MLNWNEDIATPMLQPQPRLQPAVPSASAAPLASWRAEAALPVLRGDAARTSLRRINATDKHTINGQTDVNQWVTFKYEWACEKYLTSCVNHWMPQEVTKKECNFFENRVIEYQSGGALSRGTENPRTPIPNPLMNPQPAPPTTARRTAHGVRAAVRVHGGGLAPRCHESSSRQSLSFCAGAFPAVDSNSI